MLSTTQHEQKRGVRDLSHYPRDVGIVALDVYFPSTYVSQTELEAHDGVAAGKYTVGLGQTSMAFTGDREDINSICLTAVQSLLEKYNIDPKDVGRLEVGTETLVDKSKSVKSTLMDLFQKAGNTDIEGIDTTNACYGGTNALFNAINWVESSYWDGRYALVVAGDIAVYEPGPARPTGGAAAVAMLISKGAPIVFERGIRATFMENAWDFYKPIMGSEYPLVDGALSNSCYLRALDQCFFTYAERFEKVHGKKLSLDDDVDYALFHSPYTKLVQKSWARMNYLEAVKQASHPLHESLKSQDKLRPETTYEDNNLIKEVIKYSDATYKSKVGPSLTLPKELGNSYCGSLYSGLLSLVSSHTEAPATDAEKRALMFSYGSGLAASLFSVKLKSPEGLHRIAATSDFKTRLAQRKKVAPADFVEALKRREVATSDDVPKPFVPSDKVADLFPGAFYLEKVDEKFRRTYARNQQ
jgi:hydroxymethylglutaryl-CoA synthase